MKYYKTLSFTFGLTQIMVMRSMWLVLLLSQTGYSISQNITDDILYEHFGIMFNLPSGYSLQSICEVAVAPSDPSISCHSADASHWDEFHYAYYNYVDYPSFRAVTIYFHNISSTHLQLSWARDGALSGLMGDFTEVDSAQWSDGRTSAALWEYELAAGVVLFGCLDTLCYRILISGPSAEFFSSVDVYRTIARGIVFPH